MQILSIRACDLSDSASSDASSGYALSDEIAPGERRMQMQGPVTIFGYSLECFMTAFGVAYQGLSRYNQLLLTQDTDGNYTHLWNSTVSASTDNSLSWQVEDTIKNKKWIRGYRDDPAGLTDMAGRSLHLGSAKLSKKYSRQQLRSAGKGLFKKTFKNGFILKPNTDTEFFSINIKNLQMSEDSGSGDPDAFWYCRATVWMSWDQI